MKAQKLDIKEAPNKVFALIDIRRRNELGWTTCTAKQKADAIALKRKLQNAYSAFIYDPNPRDTFISVKVAGQYPRIKDRNVLEQIERQIEQLWAGVAAPAHGTKPAAKARTEQGVIYRIPR